MTVDARRVYELIGVRFRGNAAEFSRSIGVNYTTTWRALNKKSGGEIKFIPALLRYCKEVGLNPTDYIQF